MSSPVYTAHGKTQTLQEWEADIGIKWKTLWARINNGIPLDLALSASFVKSKAPRDMAKIIEKVCISCQKPFLIPQSRDWREHSCSSECKAQARKDGAAKVATERSRDCLCCGTSFVAKKSQIDSGKGKYCSLKCSHKAVLTPSRMAPEAQQKKRESWLKGFAAGTHKIFKGEKNPQWTGGRKVAMQRLIASGRAAEKTRNYRKLNPERARDWAQKRKSGNVARLPWGTTQKLGNAQRWKCGICQCSVKGSYHLDHIMPLKLGGLHTPRNLQLLCPTCNVRKSAKHPIQYMQERGFLL